MKQQRIYTIIRKHKLSGKWRKLIAAILFFALAFGALSSDRTANLLIPEVSADNVYFPLSPINSFWQNWSNTGLIQANNDWSGAPSTIGYAAVAGGFGFGIDPQTITTDFYSNTPYIFANITNPNSTTTGSGGTGLAEFEIANPVVGIRSAVSRYAPNLDIRLDTTGCTTNDIRVHYNLRDIDAGGNNSVAQFALQYRIGGAAGDYTNIPAGYVPDATTGPNLATLVTPVNAILPSDAKNQPEVHVRIITTDAVGWDEWVGIDDLNITCGVPTAASVVVGGRAVSPNGQGLSGVTVTLTGGSLTESRHAKTNSFGYYFFGEVPSGEIYILTAFSKRYPFENPTRVLSVFDDVSDADFIGGDFGNLRFSK
jgi:hypothetical protein